MKYELAIVPPGGGKTDHSATIDNATYIPRVGEFVILVGDEEGRVEAYHVLYVISNATRIKQGQYREDPPVVYAEFVQHPYQSESHARSIEMYAKLGKTAKEYPVSGY